MRFISYFLLVFVLSLPAQADIRFLAISDIHYGSNNMPGDGHNTGNTLLTIAMQQMRQLSQHVDFILTLGDFPEHQIINSGRRSVHIKKVLQELYQANLSHKPMFYIPGNNDSLHGDYQPFSWKGHSPLTLNPLWKKACIYCEGLLIDATKMNHSGYYATYVIPDNHDMILFALNSTPFAKIPLICHYPNQAHDAEQQLDWLEIQLKSNHAKQLLIAMHIPPGKNHHGSPLWHPSYLKRFISLLSTYSSHYGEITILTSHTHMDDIRAITLPNSHPIYAYATPSISRIHHNNPAMKIFDFNKALQLKNYTTYYTKNDITWSDSSYSATHNQDSIFPECHTDKLAMCLQSLSDEEVCDRFQKGMFYGTKSPSVDHSICHLTYRVS